MTNQNLESVREALSFIPANDRALWVRCGMGLHSEFGEAGQEVFNSWSRTSSNYNPADTRDVWRSYTASPNGRTPVTIATIFFEAKKRGFKPNGDSKPHVPSPEEVAERARQEEAARAEEAARRERAANLAAEVWRKAVPVKDHSYLANKNVQPVEALREIDLAALKAIIGYHPAGKRGELQGRILVAPIKVNGQLSSLEMIDETGNKSSLRSGQKSGGFWATGPLPEGDGADQTLGIGEGVATALSVAQSLDYIGVAAFSNSNLVHVANEMRRRYPKAVLVFLADLEKATGEPDRHAIEAAREAGGILAVPDFGPNREPSHKDWNDLLVLRGPDEVRRQLENVIRASVNAKSDVTNVTNVTALNTKENTGNVTELADVTNVTDAEKPSIPAESVVEPTSEMLVKPDQSPADETTTDDTEKILAELAQLSPVAYDRVRKTSAEKLGIRIETLDAEIKSRRSEKIEVGSGRILEIAKPIPAEESVNGMVLADAIRVTFTRHVVLSQHMDVALTLWVLNTYTFDCFRTLPILSLTSAQKRCGKTSTLDVISELVCQPLAASNISPAALFRSVEKWGPTLLVDEVDSFVKDNEELRGIINSGHTRTSAFVIRTVGDDHEPRQFSTWCPKVLAGIGALPETIADRSISVVLRRKVAGEVVHKVTELDRGTMAELTRKAMRWAIDNNSSLRRANPEMPKIANDRTSDNWFPLLAIADLLGGEWPTLARAAMKSFADVQEDESNGVILLTDIAGIFEARKVSIISSSSLVDSLVELEDSPWSEWYKGKPITPRQLARLLKPFGVKPDSRRVNGHTGTIKGYRKSDFEDAFLRYLPNSGFRSGTPEHSFKNNNLNDIRSGTRTPHVPDKNNYKLLNNNACSGVQDKKGENGVPGGKDAREGVEV